MRRPTSLLLSALGGLALCAAPAAAQWKPETPVVLKGKVVSMHRAVKDGQVVIRDGKIEAILTASATPPAGAIVIDTKGYIYPGLINLHNHLRYNFVSLYPVPKDFTNHDQWPTGKEYAKHVNNPAAVVTGGKLYGRLDEALKFAEVRSIVGGETSVQGGENNPAVSRTLVRNVELKNFGVDEVGQRAFTIDRLFWKHIDEVRPSILKTKAWIFHLCEGTDNYSRLEWSDPSWDPSKPFSLSKSKRNRPGAVEAELVFPGLVGVHCLAMEKDDFKQWKSITKGNPKMVWSPTSNILLYGKTNDLGMALKEGTQIALGTDWSPSGTKNLLWELKVAAEAISNMSPRPIRGYRKLLEMVTTTPAKMLGWEDKVGQIRPGLYADLIVTDRLDRSGYKNLILAREENIQLVMVGGNPLYGDEGVLNKLKVYNGKAQYERIPETPSSRPKVIDMLQDPDTRNGDMSLAEVRERLLEALRLDPQALADTLNAGKKVSSTKTDYKAREYVRGDTIKWLKRKNLPVPARLEEPDSDLHPDDLAKYLEIKYPHLEKIDALETIYTDDKFLLDLEGNRHWKASKINLRTYVPSGGNNMGLSGALPDQD